MCGHTRGPVIYSKFHRNPFKGFGAPGGQNLAFPITLASRFYNSLYYRTSRDELFKLSTNSSIKDVYSNASEKAENWQWLVEDCWLCFRSADDYKLAPNVAVTFYAESQFM